MGCKKDVAALEKIDEYVFNKEYKADWAKVEETLKNHPNVVNDKDKKNIHFDLWGADSSSNLLMIDDMITHLKDISQRLGYARSSFSTSTNGLGLLRDEVADYHQENKVGIQLSHDGLGQFIRLRDIDVLEFDNTKRLIKNGVLSAINTTLNFYNYDIIANYKFWTDYLKTIFPDVYSKDKMATQKDSFVYQKLYIKLNHIYNGTTPVTSRNDFGIFNGKVYEQLKGEQFGDFNFTNDLERATSTARNMVTRYGFSENLGPVVYGNAEHEVFLGRDYGHTDNCSQEVASKIDKEIKRIIDEAKHRLKSRGIKTYLLLDECHRWSKAQSDAVLEAIEKGYIIGVR